MRAWVSALATLGALAPLSGCGPNRADVAATRAPPASMPAPSAPASRDAQFLNAAFVYENFQIQAAALAQARGQAEAVKTYATHASAAHRVILQQLIAAAHAGGLVLPSADLNEDYRAYLARLQSQDPTPFDARYIAEQTLLTMSMAGRYDAYTSTAPDSGLKRWAASQSQAAHDEIAAARRMAAAVLTR
jgi:predicted outer membrane protein